MAVKQNDSGNTILPHAGFTLIEAVTVLILIGILGVYVAKTSSTLIDSAEDHSQFNRLKTHLKYAQARAINSGDTWGVQFTGSQYKLFRYKTTQEDHFFSNEENNALLMDIPDTMSPLTTFIWFDSWGRAYTDSTINIATAPMISANYTIGNRIVIEANTGYIHDKP